MNLISASSRALSVSHAELVPWIQPSFACRLHTSVSAIVSLCACFLVVVHSSTAISSALPTGDLLRITPQHVRRSFFMSGDSLFYLFLVLSVWTEFSSRSCLRENRGELADQTTAEASNLHCVELGSCEAEFPRRSRSPFIQSPQTLLHFKGLIKRMWL